MDSVTPQPQKALDSPQGKARQALRAQIIDQALDDLVVGGFEPLALPEEPILDGANEGYTPEIHAKLCKLASLGLTQKHAAEALGISLTTFKTWKAKHPDLDRDLNMARWLATGAVLQVLRLLLTSENEAIVFKTAQFYLSRRTKEFRDKTDIEIEVSTEELHKRIAEQLYGRLADANASPENGPKGATGGLPASASPPHQCLPTGGRS